MREEIVRKTIEFLKEKLINSTYFQREENFRERDYRIEHSFRVANIMKEIAEKEGFDVERAYVAALLHDIGYSIEFKSKEQYREHGRIGAKIARPFLLSLGYSKDEVEEMCYGIAIHVDDKADFEYEKTPLALCIGDADNIDRFDAFRLYEALENVDYRNMPIEKQKEYVENTIEKLNKFKGVQFATKTSQIMWEEKLDFQIGFYKKLLNQILNSNLCI